MPTEDNVNYPILEVDFPLTQQQFYQFFPGNVECLKYIQKLRWPQKVVKWKGRSAASLKNSTWPIMDVCPNCSKSISPKLVGDHLVCISCDKEVPITYGTLFEGHEETLQKYFHAIWIVINGEGKETALGLKKELKCGSDKAFKMMNSIRELMGKEDFVFYPKFKEMYLDILSIDLPYNSKQLTINNITLLAAYAFTHHKREYSISKQSSDLELSQFRKLCLIKQDDWAIALQDIFSLNKDIFIYCSEEIQKYIVENNIQDNLCINNPFKNKIMGSINKELNVDIKKWINTLSKKNVTNKNTINYINEFMFKFSCFGIIAKKRKSIFNQLSVVRKRKRIKYLLENKAEEVRYGTMFYRFIQRAVGVPITDYKGIQK